MEPENEMKRSRMKHGVERTGTRMNKRKEERQFDVRGIVGALLSESLRRFF